MIQVMSRACVKLKELFWVDFLFEVKMQESGVQRGKHVYPDVMNFICCHRHKHCSVGHYVISVQYVIMGSVKLSKIMRFFHNTFQCVCEAAMSKGLTPTGIAFVHLMY